MAQINRINCRLDVTSHSKFEGIILNRDIRKYGGRQFDSAPLFRNMVATLSPEMRSIRHRHVSASADGPLLSVVIHLGGAFNAFEFHVARYRDRRYNTVQQVAAMILDKSGTVAAEELRNYGFAW